MNTWMAGIAGAAVAGVVGMSAMVFANRAHETPDTQVAQAATVPQATSRPAPTRVAEAPRTHTVCEQVRVVDNKQWGTNSVIGTVLGGAAGGVLGHQIGGGNGKKAATAVGALGGAYAGHAIANSKYPDQQVTYQQQCHEVAG